MQSMTTGNFDTHKADFGKKRLSRKKDLKLNQPITHKTDADGI